MTDEQLRETELRAGEMDWNELSMKVSEAKETVESFEGKLKDASIRLGIYKLALLRVNAKKVSA